MINGMAFSRLVERADLWKGLNGLRIALAGSYLFLIFIVLIILVPVVIGILVLRDADRRGLSRVWALAAALIPSFLGLIAYLIVSSQHKPKIQCPECKNQIDKGYHNCPHCGYKLQETCPQCNRDIAAEWKLCPHCGKQLQE